MFARRLVKSSSSLNSSSTILRGFASTATRCRAPALADITPEGVASFDAKQKEFRERMADQSRKKEASQSQANINPSRSFAPTAPSVSNASSASNQKMGTGSSQRFSAVESKANDNAADEDGKRKGGKLSSLIYGTKEGREMDREIEHSFSQVLARGKYVHSIVFHEVKPDKVDEYVDLVGSWYPRTASMPENKVHLVGSWRTEVGDCDTFGIFPTPYLILLILTISIYSPYLGIPTLSWLPRLPPHHPPSPRLPGLRQETQNPHNREAHLPHARILLLAHHRSSPTRRRLRTSLLHTTPWQFA